MNQVIFAQCFDLMIVNCVFVYFISVMLSIYYAIYLSEGDKQL